MSYDLDPPTRVRRCPLCPRDRPPVGGQSGWCRRHEPVSRVDGVARNRAGQVVEMTMSNCSRERLAAMSDAPYVSSYLNNYTGVAWGLS